jgi:hypothetical protein
MKLLLKITIALLILGIVLELFFLFLLFGSGHKVPVETYNAIRNGIIGLLIILLITVYIKIKTH